MKFVLLLMLFGATAFANQINDELALPENQTLLDGLTRTKETHNHVTLLERGLNSWPIRRELIESANDFVLISVPFWYYDQVGQEFLDWFKERKSVNRSLDIRVIQGWTSPLLSNGGGKVKGELKDLTQGHYLLWNSPFWQRRFSFDLLRGHLHDKLFVVDGKKMIIGGMNITDEDAGGGHKAKGTADFDLLIEGPAVHEGTKLFLKLEALGTYLRSSESFPPFEREEIRAFNDFFYEEKEDHDFRTVTRDPNPKPPFTDLHRVHIPIKEMLRDAKFFPQVQDGPTSVRIIYDNPLIDRDPKTKKQISKFHRTLNFAASKARSTMWVSSPYLTFDREQMDFFTTMAKKVDLRIVTNSMQSTDRNKDYYKAQISHYPAMMTAGIRLYEWLGQDKLVALSKRCQVGFLPGSMLHAKVVLLDGSAMFLGSNNVNRRSKVLNNEIMVFINNEDFSRQMIPFFENVFAGETQTAICPEGPVSVKVVEEMTEPKVRALMKALKVTKQVWKYPFGGL
jgi:phosphatidylserine/phosphatidylglycerophosphate/cardiolipin synthase-like enzyme